ncbi:hypothetical protein E2C01_022880 [Portunus trituberculatus]|uniref:Uncharacterized protein n=1 Tax=Portunus trituberculatus TaxID=210409 RepID=A0A5B7E8U6_PORTR|nr:hypothetical protein [Portunus trituberculatus]
MDASRHEEKALIFVSFFQSKMRVALGCVLLLPAALHLLLCPARASSTSPAARRTLQPLYHAQHARHDPLLDLGLLTGFSRHLSLTPQDTPLTPQPLDDLSLMERPPVHVFSSLTDDLRRSYLRDVSDFPIGDFDILQWLLEDPETSTGVTKKGRNICRGSVVSGNVWCPSTLLQAVHGGIRTYTWTSARSHAHHLIHCATLFLIS